MFFCKLAKKIQKDIILAKQNLLWKCKEFSNGYPDFANKVLTFDAS